MLGSLDRCKYMNVCKLLNWCMFLIECGNGGMLGVNVLIGAMLRVNVGIGEC